VWSTYSIISDMESKEESQKSTSRGQRVAVHLCVCVIGTHCSSVGSNTKSWYTGCL